MGIHNTTTHQPQRPNHFLGCSHPLLLLLSSKPWQAEDRVESRTEGRGRARREASETAARSHKAMAAETPAAGRSGVLKHIVLARFKEEVTPERLDHLIRGFGGLVNLVPSMKAFNWFVSLPSNFHPRPRASPRSPACRFSGCAPFVRWLCGCPVSIASVTRGRCARRIACLLRVQLAR